MGKKSVDIKNMNWKAIFCLWLFGFIFLEPVYAQPGNQIRFERISLEQGLSQVTINCIIQDKQGFMWFATQSGLNKYDGYTFTIYRHDPENNSSLSNNYIWSIFEDAGSNLWIGTEGGGLNKFDRKTETFTRYQHKSGNPKSLSSNNVLSILEDTGGNLWIGTKGGGLNKFSQNDGFFKCYQHQADNPNSISNNDVYAIVEDAGGNLWIGTMGGLNKLVPSDNEGSPPTFIHYQHQANNPHSLSNNIINSIYEDSRGKLWIGTHGGGLNKLVPSDNEGSPPTFTRYQNQADNPNSLSSNIVSSIYEDSAGCLWIGTRSGLNKLVPSGNEGSPPTFTRYQNQADNPHSLSSNFVHSIFEDTMGNLWIGTEADGLNKLDPIAESFILYQHQADNSNSLSDNNVSSILEDTMGNLWIGTHNGGLNKYDRKAETFTCFKHQIDNPESLSGNSIKSIYEDSWGDLWIGTRYAGLNKLVPSDNEGSPPTFTHYQYQIDNPKSLSNNFVSAIFEDSRGNLWIATDGGLNKLVPSDNEGSPPTFIHYQHHVDNPKSLSSNTVALIYEDPEGNLWVGTEAGGLNKLVPSDNEGSPPTFTRYQHQVNNPKSLSNNFITSIYEDTGGNLWIGTYGGGLNKFDLKTETFTCYRKKDGLPNDEIYGILEDNRGYLWLSTNNGISKFNPKMKTFTNYDKNDGLQGNEFNGGAYYKSKAGIMYFGGVNGFNAFHPDSIRDNTYIPPVVITDFLLFNKSVEIAKTDIESDKFYLQQHINFTKEIALDYTDYIFAFEFSALNYRQVEKNQFAYKLEGLDKDWIETGYLHRRATYTNISHGKYVFRTKASNDDGYWNEEGVSIKLTILPPFWQTWWFRGMIILIALGMIYAIHDVRTKSIRKRNIELTEHVEVRTAELMTTMDELTVSNEKLSQTTSQLKSVNSELKDFAYVVSHDLKAPLRGVTQIASWMSRDYADVLDEEGKEQLNLLTSRVRRMDSLIHGVLQYSRVGRISDEDKAEIDLNAMLKEIIGSLALPGHIKISIDGELPKVTAARVQLEQVFQNLLSNAIKYMDKPKGKIRIFAEDEGAFWKIGIEDNGPGIDKKYHEKIFQLFQTLESKDTNESTGVGLSVVKKIVERQGGKIWVESKVGKGSSFYFQLPKKSHRTGKSK